MAGKSLQPSHEPPSVEGRKRAPITLIKQWKEKGWTGKRKQPLSRVPTLETQALKESTDNVKLLKCRVAQEHIESWHKHRSKSC